MQTEPPSPASIPQQLFMGWVAMVATALTHARLNRTVLMGLAAAATALTCLFIFFVGALLHQDELRQLELHQDELLTPTFLRRHPKQHRLLPPSRDAPPSPPSPAPPSSSPSLRLAADDWLAPLQDAAMLLLCYNRPEYLQKTLRSLFDEAEGAARLPVYVSQDGDHGPTAEVARGFNVTLWQRPRVALLGPKQQGQAYLAQHYKWALDRVLLERGHSHAILLEDDMVFSPDFVRFFAQTAWLLRADATLWCVSTHPKPNPNPNPKPDPDPDPNPNPSAGLRHPNPNPSAGVRHRAQARIQP